MSDHVRAFHGERIAARAAANGPWDTPSRNTRAAIAMLRAGVPLPVDMVVTLVREGVDFAALERRYG